MATRNHTPGCAYATCAATMSPAFRCPPACAGPLVYRVRNYWRGPARAKLGPDMVLCEAHGKWLGGANPLGPRAVRV